MFSSNLSVEAKRPKRVKDQSQKDKRSPDMRYCKSTVKIDKNVKYMFPQDVKSVVCFKMELLHTRARLGPASVNYYIGIRLLTVK